MTDWELLRRYVEHDDEQAFLRIVERHQDFVFACAKRQAGDESTAEDVAQGVFLLLARKAPRISSGVVLTSWLFRATRYSALAALRARRRRETYERESAMHRPDSSEPGWMRLAPHLDAALDRLSEADRSALLLRYFQRQSLREVGDALGIGEEAARKRVDRAAGKLRETLLRSGVTLSMAAVLALITANRSEAAPAGFGNRISSALRDPSITPGSQLANEAGRRWAARSILPWALVCFLLLLTTSAVAFKRGAISGMEAPAPIETNTMAGASANAASEVLPVHHRMLVRVVDDADGRPLANGEIRYSFGTGLVIQNADAHGETIVPFPESVQIFSEFTAWAPGYISKFIRWNWSEWDSLPPQYTARIRKGVPIRGTVVDESDQPIPGVIVTPTWGTSSDSTREHEVVRAAAHMATSDEAGRWEVLMVSAPFDSPTNPERYQLHARHINYANATIELHPDMFPLTNGMKIVLSNGFSIRGVVTNPEGVPISGATVETFANPDFKKTVTDIEGRFDLPNLPSRFPGAGFKVKAEGYQRWEKPPVVSSNMNDVTVVLQPLPDLEHAALRGRVMDDDGRPVLAAILPSSVLYDPATAYRSDYEGMFAATNAAPGTAEYMISVSWRDPFRVMLTADGTEQKIVVPQPAVLRIEGNVIDEANGRPVPEFDVLMIPGNDPDRTEAYYWQLLASGRNGKFALRCRPSSANGKVPHLLFNAKGYRKEVLAISTNSNLMQVNIAMDPIRDLRVKILQPDGTPASGAQGGFSFSRKAPINRNGEFSPLPSAETAAVIYTADSEGVMSTPPPAATLLQLTVVHPSGYGKMLTRNRLKDTLLLSPWASVKGVLNIGGKPAAGVLLGLTCSTRHYPYNAETTTDSEGRFHFERVLDGEFILARRYIQREQYPGSNLRVFDVAPGQEVELTVGDPGVRVAGCFVAGSTASRFDPGRDRVGFRQSGQTHETPRTFQMPIAVDGTFAFDDVPAGEYTLEAVRLQGTYEPVEVLLSKKVVVPENAPSLDLGFLSLHKPL